MDRTDVINALRAATKANDMKSVARLTAMLNTIDSTTHNSAQTPESIPHIVGTSKPKSLQEAVYAALGAMPYAPAVKAAIEGGKSFVADPVDTTGAAIEGMGRTLTLGNLDNIYGGLDTLLSGGDYATNRDARMADMKARADKHPAASLLGSIGGAVAGGELLTGPKIAKDLAAGASELFPTFLTQSRLGRALLYGSLGSAGGALTAWNEGDNPIVPGVLGAVGGAAGGALSRAATPSTTKVAEEVAKQTDTVMNLTGKTADDLAKTGEALVDSDPKFATLVARLGADPYYKDAGGLAAKMLRNRDGEAVLSPKMRDEIVSYLGDPGMTRTEMISQTKDAMAKLSPSYDAALRSAPGKISPVTIEKKLEEVFANPISGRPSGGTVGKLYDTLKNLSRSHATDTFPANRGDQVDAALNAFDLKALRDDINTLRFSGKLNDLDLSASVKHGKKLLGQFADFVGEELRALSPELRTLDPQYAAIRAGQVAHESVDEILKAGTPLDVAQDIIDRMNPAQVKTMEASAKNSLVNMLTAKGETGVLSSFNKGSLLYDKYAMMFGDDTIAGIVDALRNRSAKESINSIIDQGLTASIGKPTPNVAGEVASDIGIVGLASTGGAVLPVGGGSVVSALRRALNLGGDITSKKGALSLVEKFMDPTQSKALVEALPELLKSGKARGLLDAIKGGYAGAAVQPVYQERTR